MISNIINKINQILSQSSIFEMKLDDDGQTSKYKSEKIIKRASEIPAPAPKIYNELLRIRPKVNRRSYDNDYLCEQFYSQAKFAEHLEDTFEFDGEYPFAPHYSYMNIPQLRGYFTWRTQVRKGVVEETSISYVLVYIYELLNQVGVSSPQDGFDKLLFIWEKFRVYDTKIDRYLKEYGRDYILYYGLEYNNIDRLPQKTVPYSFTLQKLYLSTQGKEGTNLTDSLNSLANYKIKKSQFYSNYSSDLDNVLMVVYNRVSEYYANYRKNTFLERIVGKEKIESWYPFQGAFFYSKEGTVEYCINDFEKYTIQNRMGKRQYYVKNKLNKKLLDELLQTTEFYLMESCKYPHTIPLGEPSSKAFRDIIRKAVKKYCIDYGLVDESLLSPKDKKKNKNKSREETKPIFVELDESKFDEIRRAAQKIQEKLIVESDEVDKPETTVFTTPIEISTATDKWQSFSEALDIYEYELVYRLLQQEYENISQVIQKSNRMAEVILESINEKALLYVEDTIVEMTDELPMIYEEYAADLQEVIKWQYQKD